MKIFVAVPINVSFVCTWHYDNEVKMASGISSEMILAQVSKRTGSDRKDVVCDCCEEMKIELNPLPVQFKAVLRGQKGCVFFSGHLNLPTTPEIGLPSKKKNHNN